MNSNTDFPVIPATKRSMSLRRPVFGVGINDSNYLIKVRVDGDILMCQFYKRWTGMLSRCYDKVTQRRQPTYAGCTVCNEWLTFSNFKKWMKMQDWEGMHLDKDILVPGNKEYSPKTCAFISPATNNLLVASAAANGEYPLGVFYNKKKNRFQVYVGFCGNQKFVGIFNNVENAKDAWLKAKADCIEHAALLQTDSRVKKALMDLAREYRS